MHDPASILEGISKLIVQAQHVVPGMRPESTGEDDFSEEGSSVAGSNFDVGLWGDEMFSISEMRGELDRLRLETTPSIASGGGKTALQSVLCVLPAMVLELPRGLYVTNEMQNVLDAVLSDTSTPQIGFCGMGGIGKTTVSSWVAHDTFVRTRFGMIAWITLGQTPSLDACINLLFLQLAGKELIDGLSHEQKHQHLKHAFLNRSVLLVLDDCWDADVVKHFNWIDRTTNSKVLLSSRVRDALDGGEIIDIVVPSKADAVKMLLSTAGMDIAALESRKEVAEVAELCNRLPLTIGIAGKLIRKLASGSKMSASNEWEDVVGLLQTELADPHGDFSVEERVIRASMKSIPKNIQTQVTRLFHGFALVPEDTLIPLPVLGMVYDACGDPSESETKPLSRMFIRKYLKVLIDLSLVLGTVDRPQLHDVMLDYVLKELSGDKHKAAQRRLVESFRKMDRTPALMQGSPIEKYLQLCITHHITSSYDDVWEKSPQAMSWLEDHVNGVQDGIAFSTASVLPNVEVLATAAEEAKQWWSAALRFNACAHMKIVGAGNIGAGFEYLKRALKVTENLAISNGNLRDSTHGNGCTQFELDALELNAIVSLLMSWEPFLLAEYGQRAQKLAAAAATSHSIHLAKIGITVDWATAAMSGNPDCYAEGCWNQLKLNFALSDETNALSLSLLEQERMAMKLLFSMYLFAAGDGIKTTPGFTLDMFGSNGDFIFDEHHLLLVDFCSMDSMVWGGAEWFLAMQFGRVTDAVLLLEQRYLLFTKVAADLASPSRSQDILFGICCFFTQCHICGQPQMIQKVCDLFGFTFDSLADFLSEIADTSQNFTLMEQKGPGGKGFISLKKTLWHVKSFLVMHTDVPTSKARAWLESLPDDEAFIQYSITAFPTQDQGSMLGSTYQTCWIALAHETVGLYDGALRFCSLALETDLAKGAAPHTKWARTVAQVCKGRVFAKRKQDLQALEAFQAATEIAKQSFPVIEALAYRELVSCFGTTDGHHDDGSPAAVAVASAQAAKFQENKLKEFGGRLTKAEFDILTIGIPE